jgi:hypothetical protein
MDHAAPVRLSTMIHGWGDFSVNSTDKSPQRGILILRSLLRLPDGPLGPACGAAYHTIMRGRMVDALPARPGVRWIAPRTRESRRCGRAGSAGGGDRGGRGARVRRQRRPRRCGRAGSADSGDQGRGGRGFGAGSGDRGRAGQGDRACNGNSGDQLQATVATRCPEGYTVGTCPATCLI